MNFLPIIGYLPLDNLMDSVYFHNLSMPMPPYRFYGGNPERDKIVTETFAKRTRSRVFCNHSERGNYVRIDHRAGPGSFADNFEGKACKACGKIFEEIQTN